MQAIKCEMCNSNDFVKEDGYFVCQHCGTKYTVEEAKKLMVEGTVKIDSSENVQKWFTVARRAKESDDVETARKYYQKILEEDPNSWEANFYSVYYDSINIKNSELESAIERVNNSLNSTLNMIELEVQDTNTKQAIIDEIIEKIIFISNYYLSASKNLFNSMPFSMQFNEANNLTNRTIAIGNLMLDLGDYLRKIGDQESIYAQKSVEIYKKAIELMENNDANLRSRNPYTLWKSTTDKIERYAQIIKETDPTYKTIRETKIESKGNKKSGCYVATAVYGSYDCPQVWTLRRYRDNTLAETWYGRAFIHTYYAISPTLVKWFGDTKWIKKMWQGKLDRMVKRLKDEGVEDTPYEDRIW